MCTSATKNRKSLSEKRRLAPAAVVCALAMAACSGGAPSGNNGGVDSGSPAGDGMAASSAVAFALDSGVTSSQVDGLAIRSGWSRLEPSEGIYDWSSLDLALAQVAAANKRATVHILGSTNPQVTPSWLMAAGVKFYSNIKGMDPVPWDAVFLQKWSNFLPKLAEHLRTSGQLAVIANMTIAVPVPEMNLISCRNGMLDGVSIPYDRARYLAAWKQMVDLYQAAFPEVNRLISAPQNGICFADNDTQFYHELLSYALGKDGTRHAIFAADLSAQGSARVQPYLDLAPQAAIYFQPVAAYTNDPNHWVKGSLLQLYCAGLKMGARYFEVYATDLNSTDPAVQQGISAIRQPALCP